MRYIIFAIGLAALIAVPALSLQAQPTGAIVAGKSIGPVEIGMSMERAQQLVAQFGRTETVDTQTERGVCNPERGVGVCAFDKFMRLGLDQPGTVAYIITDDQRFLTEQGGHKVGATLLDFLRTYGLYNFGQRTEIRWDGRGLVVSVGATDAGIVVNFIGVYAPRGSSAQAPPRVSQ
jgi:hypothetical protein